MAQLSTLGRRAFMKISRHIWFFMGFAFLVVMAYAAWWIFGSIQSSKGSAILFALIDYSFLLVGFAGIFFTLVAWLFSGVLARRRAKKLPQEDLSHV